MRKGIVMAAAAVVIAAAVAGGWWARHRDVSPGAVAQTDATPAQVSVAPVREDAVARAARVRAHLARYQRLWREAGFADVRRQAEAGDALAQRRLSEIYEDCAAYTGRLRNGLVLLQQLGGAEPASKPAIDQLFAEINRICPPAIADLSRNRQLATYWLHRSAKAGDTVAEMRYFSRTAPTLTPGQLAYFVEKARNSGEPDAIFEISQVLGRLAPATPWPDPAQAPALRGANAEQAWVLTACRAGYDCLRGSRLMHLLCINTLSCTQPDYPRYLAARAGYAEQQVDIERLRGVIERNLLARIP